MALQSSDQELKQKLTMDPNQDEELKNLSSRTEELLSRLNDLSANLNSQLKFTPPETNSGPSLVNEESENLPEIQDPKTLNKVLNNVINASDGRNYYSIPVNTQYLEKSEKRIQTTELGANIMTTSSTSIIKEERHFQSTVNQPSLEGFVPAHIYEKAEFEPIESLPPANNNFQNTQASTPTLNIPTPQVPRQAPLQSPIQPSPEGTFNYSGSLFNVAQADFQETPLRERPINKQTERQFETASFQDKNQSNIKGIDPDDLTRVIGPRKPGGSSFQNKGFRTSPDYVSDKGEERLQPAAIFSSDQRQTKRAPQRKPIDETFNEVDYRTKEIADQLAEHNREIKSRLNRYSKRLQVNGQTDNLRLFAWLVLFFSPLVPIVLIKNDLILAIACSSLALFFGIFFFMLALRVAEISELVRWAHNQILLLQSKVETGNAKNNSD